MLLFDAIFINNSGGRVLLDVLVKEIELKKIDVFFLFDHRCSASFQDIPVERKQFIKGIFERHQFYKKNQQRFSKVFCFGNVSPTVKLNIEVYTYFHNLLIITPVKELKFLARIDLKLKALFIKFFLENTNFFIVQSSNVKQELVKYYKLNDCQCKIIPFYENFTMPLPLTRDPSQFLFVSDGNPHKNHLRLLEAWQMINKVKPHYSLHLTVSPSYPKLQNLIAIYQKKGVNVINHSYCTKNELNTLYQQSRFAIYPSLIESFGLGLVEAFNAGCEIIASNLPYVHAIIHPLATFHPLSETDIAETILQISESKVAHTKSFLKISNQLEELLDLLN